MIIEFVPIDSITPYANNAKEHTDEQVALLAANIKEFGFDQPIVVDKDGVIIKGHGRLLAAKMLQLPKVPIVRASHLAPAQVKAARLADNQINLMTGILMKLATPELKDLPDNLFDLTGYDRDLLIDPNENDDDAPTPPEEAKTTLGELWQLGAHRLLIGDATDKGTVDRLMAGFKADLIFTDLPYNVAYKSRGKNLNDKGTASIMNDDMDAVAFDNFLADVFANYKSVTKTGAGAYIFHSTSTQAAFERGMAINGFRIKNQLIWNKPTASMGWGDYRWKHEPFFYAGIGDGKTQFYGDRTNHTIWNFHDTEEKLVAWAKNLLKAEKTGKTTIWTMKRDKVNEYVHPTQKPVELIENALFNSSKQGDIVVDFFGGSGSTLIACQKTGRVAFSMELDPRFADVILTRYAKYAGDDPVREDGTRWSTLSGVYIAKEPEKAVLPDADDTL